MKVGLLWFDDNPQLRLEDKLGRAALRYREKFGRVPDICYVNPQMVSASGRNGEEPSCRLESLRVTIRLVPAGYMLRHHFLLAENGGGRADGR